MKQEKIGKEIRDKALEIGFDGCGIIKIDEIKEYFDTLNKNSIEYPELKLFYDNLGKLAFPEKTHQWAKSIIVCVNNYGKYKIPENLNGIISKFYLFDYKWKNNSTDFKKIELFEKYLEEAGIKFVKDSVLGVTPSRLAAVKANLGIIRKNNFFYNKNGSWSWIETWVTDREMEFKEDKNDLEECPEGCNECIKSCPTKALCKPYFTNILTCVTRLSYGARGVTPKPLRDKMGSWIYGCDLCQNSCPMNKGKWKEDEDFKYLDEKIMNISLEEIFLEDEENLKKMFFPVFAFINHERIWVWKCNVIIAMANNYQPKYREYIDMATTSENENIREVGLWAKERIKDFD
ncbi:MAG TPA: 4Fe-4S double cluster binding domain-containing protein [Spirochaetota bacterium]|nr:4Fe-4S double cluster binding domain-containing protein [Spirochaetota bacterium]